MAILLPALVFLLPLLITPGILFHYDITPKVAILSVIVALCVILVHQLSDGIAALWSRRTGRWLCALSAAQTIWYAVATGFSSRPWFSLFGSNWRRMGLLTVVALCAFAVLAAADFSARRETLVMTLRAFTIATVVASTYGILQYFDIDPLQPASAYQAHAGDSVIVRPPGPLGHADYFGWWLAIALFCAVALSRVETGFWRWTARVACILAGAAIVLSGTRSAILAVVAGFFCLGLLSDFRPRSRHVIGALLFVGLVAAFYVSHVGTRLQARVRWSTDEPIGGARPLLWRDSFRMAATRPWVGFGPETFAAEFPRYQSVELARLLPDFYHESPHNTAIDALTSEGIPGLLIALGWVLLGASAAYRGWRAGSALAPALASALTASSVASLFGAMTVGPIFATMLVIAMSVAEDPPNLERGKSNRPWVMKPMTVLAVSAPLAACLGVFAVVLSVADYRLSRFQQRSNDAGTALTLYQTSLHAALPGAAEDLYCSRRLAMVCGGGQSDCATTAMAAAARATSTADNPPNAWYNLAMLAAAQDDAAEVEGALRTSAALAPNWFKPHWALANLLAVTGRDEEALKEARKAFLLDAGKDPEVIQTVAKLARQPR